MNNQRVTIKSKRHARHSCASVDNEAQAYNVDLVTIRRFSELHGFTEGAVRQWIKRGKIAYGEVWIHAPIGRTLISISGFQAAMREGS